MTHIPSLVSDLASLLVAAAIVSALFKKLKQPVILGYLLAGIIVGPELPLFPSIEDRGTISEWAELGVVFMLFGLGLEFSFRKLLRVGTSALVTALFEISLLISLGYGMGRFLGFAPIHSLFLGGMLSISSTAIIVRTFEEMHLKKKGFAALVFGILIFEDLIAVLLLVVLSSVAVTQALEGAELLASLLKLAFFVATWFLAGTLFIPSLLEFLRKELSDEMLLILSLGLCLLMVLIGTHSGFSPALGAFVMGSLLSETFAHKRIEHLLEPIKNLFSAVFFVSVGMLIEMQVLVQHFGIILGLTILVILGKTLGVTVGALLTGQPIKKAVQAGMSLSQIGEFSFIIATLGKTLGVIDSSLYPIIVAVSALTSLITPYWIRLSEPFARFLETRIPNTIQGALVETSRNASKVRIPSLLIRTYGPKIALNSVVIIAFTLTSTRILGPWLRHTLPDMYHFAVDPALALLTLTASSPFLWAIASGKSAPPSTLSPEVLQTLERVQIVLSAFRVIYSIALSGLILSRFTSPLVFSIALLVGALFLLIGGTSRFSARWYQSIESRFLNQLSASERQLLQEERRHPKLAPWDTELRECIVSPDSPLVGQSLQTSRLKETFGVVITLLERGSKRWMPPQSDTQLFPYDRLYLVGQEKDIERARNVLEQTLQSQNDNTAIDQAIGLRSLQVGEHHSFSGKILKESGIRNLVSGVVVGVERKGKRILSPPTDFKLENGDLIWIVGDSEKIRSLSTTSTE